MIDAIAEEPIRSWPVWFARTANLLLHWTDKYCSGGCGYPVTGMFEVEIDKIDDVPVVMLVCSLGSECARIVEDQPVDGDGQRYSEIRPAIKSLPRNTDRYRLAFTR